MDSQILPVAQNLLWEHTQTKWVLHPRRMNADFHTSSRIYLEWNTSLTITFPLHFKLASPRNFARSPKAKSCITFRALVFMCPREEDTRKRQWPSCQKRQSKAKKGRSYCTDVTTGVRPTKQALFLQVVRIARGHTRRSQSPDDLVMTI